MFFWAESAFFKCDSATSFWIPETHRISNFSAISPSWPLNLGDLSSLNYDLKCHMNGDTISALHSFTISSRWPVLQCFSQNHGSQNFNLWPQNRDACVFKYGFFSVILYIGLHPQHTLYGLCHLQFSLLIIIFTASQVFYRFWGHVLAGFAFSVNIYLLGLPINVFICYLHEYKTCSNM